MQEYPEFAGCLVLKLIERVRHTTEQARRLALSGVYERAVALLNELAVGDEGRTRFVAVAEEPTEGPTAQPSTQPSTEPSTQPSTQPGDGGAGGASGQGGSGVGGQSAGALPDTGSSLPAGLLVLAAGLLAAGGVVLLRARRLTGRHRA